MFVEIFLICSSLYCCKFNINYYAMISINLNHFIIMKHTGKHNATLELD